MYFCVYSLSFGSIIQHVVQYIPTQESYSQTTELLVTSESNVTDRNINPLRRSCVTVWLALIHISCSSIYCEL